MLNVLTRDHLKTDRGKGINLERWQGGFWRTLLSDPIDSACHERGISNVGIIRGKATDGAMGGWCCASGNRDRSLNLRCDGVG